MNSKPLTIILSLVFMLNLESCQSENNQVDEETEKPAMTMHDFGEADGQPVSEYRISFPGKLEASVITYGGIITSLRVPDKAGNMEEVVLGFNNLADYQEDSPYFGALIGRYGNRIAGGKFTLDGQEYTLATNNGANHLHGGEKGFDKVVWTVADTTLTEESAKLVLNYTSPDGEEGYPGDLETTVTYLFSPDGIEITYEATTDKTTVLNLTQHTYFNLSGNGSDDILGHELMLNASRFLPVDITLIPTGELRPVEGTPFDFTTAKPIGQEIEAGTDQLVKGLGYDHCWILNESDMNTVAASLYHPGSGRYMEVYTTEPAIQFYSGNFLDGSLTGRNNTTYEYRTGLALETEHYPDSPNQSDFPSVVLEPGETYSTKTSYRFSTK